MPLHVTIGNHDSRAAFPHAPVSEGGFVQEAFDTPEGRFIILDTHEPGRAEGGLCDRRLAWLKYQLRSGSGPVFLSLHHPPFQVGLGRMDRIRLLDANPLLTALRPHLGRVRQLFVGHLHRALAGSWHGVPLSGFRGTNHQIALDFATQDVAPVSFEARGYGVVLHIARGHHRASRGTAMMPLGKSLHWVGTGPFGFLEKEGTARQPGHSHWDQIPRMVARTENTTGAVTLTSRPIRSPRHGDGSRFAAGCTGTDPASLTLKFYLHAY